MVQFQKLTRNLFLTLHRHSVHHQQQQLFTFLVHYQQLASPAYCGAKGPVYKMASQQENTFCVLCFEVSRFVITVQHEFCARFRTAGNACATSSSKPCTDLDTSKRSTQKSFSRCYAILDTSPLAPQYAGEANCW
jgi:hypothetical protein